MARRGKGRPIRSTDLGGILFVDAAEIDGLEGRLRDLSDRMQERVIRRSYATVMRRMDVEVARAIRDGTQMRIGAVRKKIRSMNLGGSVLTTVRSPWIPLADLGAARQTKTGVTVRGWGRHRGAFIAGMQSGHRGVFVRKGKDRLPIKELWGPNPAAYVVKNPTEFTSLLEDIARTELLPEINRQIDLAIRGL